MLDIFGEPNWLGLADGVFGDFLGRLLEALNYFLVILPFWLSILVSGHLKSKNAPNWMIAPVTLLTFLVILAAFYVAYPYTQFPYWIRWFPR